MSFNLFHQSTISSSFPYLISHYFEKQPISSTTNSLQPIEANLWWSHFLTVDPGAILSTLPAMQQLLHDLKDYTRSSLCWSLELQPQALITLLWAPATWISFLPTLNLYTLWALPIDLMPAPLCFSTPSSPSTHLADQFSLCIGISTPVQPSLFWSSRSVASPLIVSQRWLEFSLKTLQRDYSEIFVIGCEISGSLHQISDPISPVYYYWCSIEHYRLQPL